MATLLKLELEKLFRAKSFYLSLAVLTAFVALMLWGFYTYAARKTGGRPLSSSSTHMNQSNISTG
jgi:ABC-type transport system involved in multi-copper enzyme maturation permease subunit